MFCSSVLSFPPFKQCVSLLWQSVAARRWVWMLKDNAIFLLPEVMEWFLDMPVSSGSPEVLPLCTLVTNHMWKNKELSRAPQLLVQRSWCWEPCMPFPRGQVTLPDNHMCPPGKALIFLMFYCASESLLLVSFVCYFHLVTICNWFLLQPSQTCASTFNIRWNLSFLIGWAEKGLWQFA